MNKLAPLAFALALASSAAAAERATYNSAGGLTALITDGSTLPVHGEFVVSFLGGVRQSLQPHDQRSPIERAGAEARWTGLSTFPNGGQAQFEAAWADAGDGVAFTGHVISGGPPTLGAPPARWPLLVDSVEYVLDIPRPAFEGGHLEPGGAELPVVRPANPVFVQQSTAKLEMVDAQRNWKLSLVLDHPRALTVTDRWTADGRSYRVRIPLGSGFWPAGDTLPLGFTLTLTGVAHAAPVHLVVAPEIRRYPFDGFGGNFCFATRTPAADYLMDTLQPAWARFELKASYWDFQRSSPGPELRRDFELMQRFQALHRPWIISLWRLPERYYTDPNQRPAGSFNRQIAPDRWPEFLDLIGSYLVHLKKNYGAEPDYFSFNEPDLGVDIGFTPETHREMIKRVGAYLASLGLKTKMLLGDTANPRDSHKYVLPTAADPEAMKYVGAISFHSWGGGTPQQYGAWGEVADWIGGLPLIVAEAGTDPGSWRNHAYDSYTYGLGEIRQFQELLRDSRPQALIYWQYTEDYGLVHVKADGTIEPTGRYWLMKQLATLTPRPASVVRSTSDEADVLVSAFVHDQALVLHILNTGAAREAVIGGLPAGPWHTVVTTELAGLQASAGGPGPDGRMHLAARSLTTLIRGE